MSKTTKSIIIAASVIIVLIVGTIVISNIDTSKDNNVDTTDDLYSIYSADTTDILSVKSESENGTITVKSIGDSEWSVNDMDASEIDSSKAGALVGTISTLSSKNKIEENTADLSQYGLDNPQVTVTVEKKNGQIDKMIIGDLSPTLGEYFVMKDGDNTVYTMYDFKVDTLKKPISYYKEFNRFNINIDNINDIKIVRSDETIEIRILSNINNNTNNVWEMVQPYQSGANDDYIDNKILAPIEEISLTTPIENADGGFSEKSPVLMITVKPYDNSTGKYGEEYTETLTIGRTDGDMTYVKYKEQVFKVSSDIISFANDSSYNIVSKLQALVDISEVKSVTVEYNGAEHTIDITHNDHDVHVVIELDDGHVRGVAEVPAADALEAGVGFAGDGDLHANAPLLLRLALCSGKSYVSFRANYSLNCVKHALKIGDDLRSGVRCTSVRGAVASSSLALYPLKAE